MAEPVFSGDGNCPKCSSFVFLEWEKGQSNWHCQFCGHNLDIRDTITMLASYRPERNSADLDEVKRRIRLNLGLPPNPVVQPSRPRSFWHPVEFAKNLAVGLIVDAVWRRWRR